MPCRELHAKFLLADEGCPQGPRTHHTRTMRAFSSASAAQLTCPPRHTRYKTRPARPHQHRTRYKTRPTHHKTPNLGTFSRAGRIYSRMRIEQAEHEDFSCTRGLLSGPSYGRRPPRPQPGGAPHRQAKPDIRPPTFTPLNPTTVDESGGHRQDRDERKYAHA